MTRARKKTYCFETLESRSLLSASPLLGGGLLGAVNNFNIVPVLQASTSTLTGSLSPVVDQVLSAVSTTVSDLGTALNQDLTATLTPLASGLTPLLTPVVSNVTQTIGSVVDTTATVVSPVLVSPIVTSPVGTLPLGTTPISTPVGTLPIVTVPGIPTSPITNTPTLPGTLPTSIATSPIVAAPAPATTSTNNTTVNGTPIQGTTSTINVPTQAVVTLSNGVAATIVLDEVPTIQVPAAVVTSTDTAEPAFIIANATAVDGFLVVPVEGDVTLAASSPARSVAPSTEAELVEASVTPFALLEQAMGEGIDRLDQFVNSSLESLVPGRDSYSTLSWLTALAVAGLVYEVARRDMERKHRARLPLPVGTNLPEMN